MRLDAKTVRSCAGGISAAQTALPEDRGGIKRLLAGLGREGALCAAAADRVLRDTDALKAVKKILESGECFTVRGLAVGGEDLIELGFKKGPALGDALEALLQNVIEHPEDNARDRLLELAREMRG